MSSTQCFPWVSMCICAPFIGISRKIFLHGLALLVVDIAGWTSLWNWAWGSGRLSGSYLPQIWFWFLVFPKITRPGDFSAWCNIFFMMLWKPPVAEQIPMSYRLPEKSMFPSFWPPDSSETLIPFFRSSSCNQACCAAWGGTPSQHGVCCGKCTMEPFTPLLGVTPLLWTTPVGEGLSGFKRWVLEVVLMAWISI